MYTLTPSTPRWKFRKGSPYVGIVIVPIMELVLGELWTGWLAQSGADGWDIVAGSGEWTPASGVTPDIVNAAGGTDAYTLTQRAAIYALAAQWFPLDPPPHGWCDALYVPPTMPYDPTIDMADFVKDFEDTYARIADDATRRQYYRDKVLERNDIILMSDSLDLAVIQASIPSWVPTIGMTAAQMIAWCAVNQDAGNI